MFGIFAAGCLKSLFLKKAGGRFRDRVMGALFAEELGALLQIRRDDRARVMQVLRTHGLVARERDGIISVTPMAVPRPTQPRR